jgi:putative transposase
LCDKIAETGGQRHSAQAKPDIQTSLRRRTLQGEQHHRALLQQAETLPPLATRYNKLLGNFIGFVKLAAIAIWLKWLNCHYALVD